MWSTRRQFIGQMFAATLAATMSDTAATSPSCSFHAPFNVLARAGAQIHSATTFAGTKNLPTDRIKTYAQDLQEAFSEQTVQLALAKDYFWETTKLTLAFLGSIDLQFQKTIMNNAADWSPFSGIHFDLVPHPPANIRIEVVDDGQNWSQYGTEATKVAPNQATMHFGTINQYSSDDDIYRVVVHEFGHALGALHEHQSPAAAGIDWNTAVVNDHYHRLGWSDAMIQANVYATFPPDATYCTRFDPLSIMIYDFPSNFTTNHLTVKPNFRLSDLDKSGMKALYDQARSHH